MSSFLAIKAPSIACWALAIAFAYNSMYNYWFIIPSLFLLLVGIVYFNKESEKREKKEREKQDREFWLGVGNEAWNHISKWFDI
jgi:hypothetical protein